MTVYWPFGTLCWRTRACRAKLGVGLDPKVGAAFAKKEMLKQGRLEVGRNRRQGRMIKSELVQRISLQNPHLYQRDVENIVNAILDEIIAAMARGDRVELRGFGAFSVKNRPARTGRNPRTGATRAARRLEPLRDAHGASRAARRCLRRRRRNRQRCCALSLGRQRVAERRRDVPRAARRSAAPAGRSPESGFELRRAAKRRTWRRWAGTW